ncbi:uncharacterized protein L201_004940 [Kwoniella dendrophila CBS 6074]|uniref:LIM zinc-binding domain-containing protein n=1 Tax=Kwoniella dendrophila CBS 6074 TaxID=1295534 RepID=A0AAX4JX46_9TREE
MIVCGLCGTSIQDLGFRCSKCSGRAIERSNSVRALLSSPQKRGSPDRWAEKYTTPKSPSSVSPSPLSQPRSLKASNPNSGSSSRPGFSRTDTFDVALTASSDAELARGTCHYCSLPIIGDREEGLGGQHISARTFKWHGKCFGCSVCGKLPTRQSVPLLFPDAKPACHDCYEQWAAEPNPKPSKPAVDSIKSDSSHKYGRPGQVIGTTSLPSQPSTTATELKQLMQPRPVTAATETGSGSCELNHITPLKTSPTFKSSTNPLNSSARENHNHQNPRHLEHAGKRQPANTGSVLDRVRQLNARANPINPHARLLATHSSSFHSSNVSDRQPLHPLPDND